MYHPHMRCLIKGRKGFTRIVVSRTTFPCHFLLSHWRQCFCFQLVSLRVYFTARRPTVLIFSWYSSVTLSAFHGKRRPKPSSSIQFSLFSIHHTQSPTHLTVSNLCNWETDKRKLLPFTSVSDKMLQGHIISRLHEVPQFNVLFFYVGCLMMSV
jgi:hypothetical protein